MTLLTQSLLRSCDLSGDLLQGNFWVCVIGGFVEFHHHKTSTVRSSEQRRCNHKGAVFLLQRHLWQCKSLHVRPDEGLTSGRWCEENWASPASRISSPDHNLLPVGSTMPSEHSSREKNIFIPSPSFLLSSFFSFMAFSVMSDKLPLPSAWQISRLDWKRTTAQIQRSC